MADDNASDKGKPRLMPWERPKADAPARKKRGRPRKSDKPKRDAATTKKHPQVHLQQDRGIVDILREMREASTEDLPLGGPPVENRPGVFENAAPDPKIFSNFESSETTQHTDGYKDEYPSIAEKATRVGFTVKELAALFDVKPSKINTWILRHPEFAAAVRMGRGQADDRVERNLFERACGYEYLAEKPMNVGGKIEIAQYKEHVKPDIIAQIFWLKNRRPENWRDVQQHEHGNAGEFASMDDKQLMEEIQKASQELAKLSNTTEQDEESSTKH